MAIKFLNTVSVDSSVLHVDAATDRVGIGTASPSQKLTVSGNILATGTITGSNLSGTNTGDQDLSVYYTKTESDGRFVNVTGDTMTGALNMGSSGITGVNFNISGVNQLSINDPGEGIVWNGGSSGNITLATVDDASDNILRLSGTGASLQVGTNTVWHAGNDGSGSGLDADLLDGQHASAFQPAGTYNTIIGTSTDVNTSGNTVIDNIYVTDGVITSMGSRALTNVSIEDTRAAEKMPNDYLDKSVSFDFTSQFGSLGQWYSGVTLKGWSDGYAAWQLVSNSNTSTNDDNLYFRTGVGTSWGSFQTVWTDNNLTNISQLNNDSGYTTNVGDITGVTAGANLNGGGTSGSVTLNLDSNISVDEVNIGQGIELRESTDRADLLQITSATSTWAGIQVRNSANEGRWSFMTDGSSSGFYDDENGDWSVMLSENSGVTLFHNGSNKFYTYSGGVVTTGVSQINNDTTSTTTPTLQMTNDSGGDIFTRLYEENNGHAWMSGMDVSDGAKYKFAYAADGNSLTTGTKMTIQTDGKVGIGVSPTQKLQVDGNALADKFMLTSSVYSELFLGQMATTGLIRVGVGGGGSWAPVYASAFNVMSDYRLKSNVVTLGGAIDRVKQLNVYRFNWNDKLDEDKVDGFIAHELAAVIPEAVTGEKDALHEDGTADHQGVDQAKVVPLLTAALKEAIEKIEQLETRIQTLENNN